MKIAMRLLVLTAAFLLGAAANAAQPNRGGPGPLPEPPVQLVHAIA